MVGTSKAESSEWFLPLTDDELEHVIAGFCDKPELIDARSTKLNRLVGVFGRQLLIELAKHNILGLAFDTFLQYFPYFGTMFESQYLKKWSYLENIGQFAKFWKTRHHT